MLCKLSNWSTWTTRRLVGAGLLAMLCALPVTAFARCQILAPMGSAPNINGSIDATEWADAYTVSSTTNGCLAGLVPVEVKAKRDAGNLYLAFHVTDSTTPGASDLGDRIIIQLSPAHIDGSDLGNGESYKFNVGHKWTQLTLDADRHYQSSSGTLLCPAGTPAGGASGDTVPAWTDQTWPTGMEVRVATATGGYGVEFKIPKAAFGNPASIPSDLAISFIVIDDRSTEAYASWFPSGLPVDAVSTTGQIISPEDPTGSCNEWVRRANWGLASIALNPDVFMSRLPHSWWSEDIDTMQCPVYTPSGDQYNYYPTNPCRMKVEYYLRNRNTFVEHRDVLVLASAHGAGALQWKKIQFRPDVSVPAATSSTSPSRTGFLSETAGGTDNAFLPPPGINAYGHPCVRVYVLPTYSDPAFPKSRMVTDTDFTDADLTAIETTYHLDVNHWAQQNITRAATPSCPNSGCQIASLDGLKVAGPSPLEAGAGLMIKALNADVFPSAHAQSSMQAGVRFSAGKLQEAYVRDNIIAVVRAYTRAATPPSGRVYRITQEFGGVVQMFPIKMVKEGRPLAAKLFVGNTKSTAQTVFLKTTIYAPPGFEKSSINLPTEPRTLQPHGSFVAQGELSTQPTCKCGDVSCLVKGGNIASSRGGGSLASLALLIGVAGVGGFAILRRRKRK